MGINGQFGSHSRMTEAAMDLVGVRQKREESIATMAGGVSVLTKVAYSDTAKKKGPCGAKPACGVAY